MKNLKKQVGLLLNITNELAKRYPPKKFTLDGRLIGDIGETMAVKTYQIELYQKVETKYDAFIERSSKKVQIKSTMKDSISYPKTHHPERFLALKILENGDCVELYNGPTDPIKKYLALKKRKGSENFNFINIKANTLTALNEKVKHKDRIPKRNK